MPDLRETLAPYIDEYREKYPELDGNGIGKKIFADMMAKKLPGLSEGVSKMMLTGQAEFSKPTLTIIEE